MWIIGNDRMCSKKLNNDKQQCAIRPLTIFLSNLRTLSCALFNDNGIHLTLPNSMTLSTATHIFAAEPYLAIIRHYHNLWYYEWKSIGITRSHTINKCLSPSLVVRIILAVSVFYRIIELVYNTVRYSNNITCIIHSL